eukprot:6973565-Lingulodinium_polyedra.AAC.1
MKRDVNASPCEVSAKMRHADAYVFCCFVSRAMQPGQQMGHKLRGGGKSVACKQRGRRAEAARGVGVVGRK